MNNETEQQLAELKKLILENRCLLLAMIDKLSKEEQIELNKKYRSHALKFGLNPLDCPVKTWIKF